MSKYTWIFIEYIFGWHLMGSFYFLCTYESFIGKLAIVVVLVNLYLLIDLVELEGEM